MLHNTPALHFPSNCSHNIKFRWAEWHFSDNLSHISSPFALFFFHLIRKSSSVNFQNFQPRFVQEIWTNVQETKHIARHSFRLRCHDDVAIRWMRMHACARCRWLTAAGPQSMSQAPIKCKLVCHWNRRVRATLAFLYSCHSLAGKKRAKEKKK